MAKRITTLYIRDTGIHLLVMKGNQVEKWATSPLEPGLVSQGLIVDEAQVADRIKQLFKETGAKAKKVIIALSGHDSLYRIITLPELPDAVLPEAIKREVKRTIPTPLDEVYFSYQRLPSSKGESRVFLVAFPRNLVDALVRTLRQAGVKPYVMDLAPLALCRILDEPRAIIVNARLDYLDVIVLADRLPQVIRRLSLPGEADSLEGRLPLISEEFNRTVTFYNTSHLENPLDAKVPVFVCGDLAGAPDSWQSVVGGAGYSVSALPSPVEAPEGFDPNEFIVNIGLAFRELLIEKEGANFSIVNFNALPEAYTPARFSVARVLLPIVTVVGIGLVVLALILVLTNRASIESLHSDVTSSETSVTNQQEAITALNNQIDSNEATANALSAMLENMEEGRDTFHEDLTEIEWLARNTVTLTSINDNGASVTLKGTASDENDIFRYAENLRASTDNVNELRFSRVWISSITGSGGGFSFSLALTR